MTGSLDAERIIVVGAGLHGLMCALEAQRQKGMAPRQVDLIARTFPSDPPPISWCTGLSSCFFGCVKATSSDFEERTLRHLLELAKVENGLGHQFEHSEEYSLDAIEESRVLPVPQFREVPVGERHAESKHAASFTSVSFIPSVVGTHLLNEFVSAGGRIFRGSVRHLNDVVEGGTIPFQRGNNPAQALQYPTQPSAVIFCVGLGARFIGGIEDKEVYPTRIQVVRLRLPWVKIGKAFYDDEKAPIFFAVPLGNGDVIVGGSTEENDWYPLPRPETTTILLEKARELCPYLTPEQPVNANLRSFLVWEGCDVFAARRGGPRLEVQMLRCDKTLRDVPIIFNYGFGTSEIRTFTGVAESVAGLTQGAMEQAGLISVSNANK